MSKFTKGPWKQDHEFIVNSKREIIADIVPVLSDLSDVKKVNKIAANARLIIAAPEMYKYNRALLEALDEYSETFTNEEHEEYTQNVSKVLAKIDELLSRIDGEPEAQS